MSTIPWHLLILCTVYLQFVAFALAEDLVITSTDSAAEQGETTSIEPIPALPKPEVYSLHVYSDIKYRYATTVVTSRVANSADKAQQIDFTVVLPENAFISGFLMVVDENIYKAYVKEKEEAKKEFTQAVEQGISAAHVEQNARDSNQFTVSVNVEPHDKVDFNLTYEQLLTRSLGVYSNVININPGQIVRDMSVNVKINESAEITKLEVSDLQTNNEIEPDDKKSKNELANIEKIDSNVVTIRWAPTQEQQKEIAKDGVNGQLTVKYDVNREKNPQQILVDEGYFVHFFAPESLPILRKHVVFVLDYSGSMAGRKLEQLKDAMQTILSDLDEADYFSLVLFSDVAVAWYPNINVSDFSLSSWSHHNKPNASEVTSESVVPAAEPNKKLAIEFLKEFSDLGSTNIIDGLRKGIQLTNIGKGLFQKEAVQPEPLIIFLTDGLPNVEIYNPEDIIKEVRKLNEYAVTIFSLGFGYGADIKFLRKLSLSSNGFARNIYEASDAALQLKNFYKEVASPLLANITFNYLPGQVDNKTASRVSFPTYFDGSELVVVGKLHDPQEEQKEAVKAGELVATTSTGVQSYPIIIDNNHPHPPVPAREEPSHLEKVWAYLTIQQLLDDFTVNESNSTKKKALDLALQYSFVTPLTSLVVVKPNVTSAVDAEAVRPGDGNPVSGFGSGAGGVAYVPQPIAFGLPPSPNAFEPLPPPNEFVIHGEAPDSPPKATTTFVPAVPPVGKLNILDDISWLKKYLSADGSKVLLQLDENTSKEYKLGRNETDTTYGTCNIGGETRICRHLEHCVLDVFKDNFDKFLSIICDIPSGYVGVCCPH